MFLATMMFFGVQPQPYHLPFCAFIFLLLLAGFVVVQEIPDDDLVLGEVLGHGEFGSVQKATYKPNGGQEMVTAVKVLKRTSGWQA